MHPLNQAIYIYVYLFFLHCLLLYVTCCLSVPTSYLPIGIKLSLRTIFACPSVKDSPSVSSN